MFNAEHSPPHFHVRYNEFKAAISIKNLSLIEGKLPPKVLGLVVEWASLHQAELLRNWELAQKHLPLKPILPLE